MSKQEEESAVREWAEAETRPVDVVASWESLLDAYRALEFSDPLSDTVRLEEFKWIVKEMNKHLSRARKSLLSCRDMASARRALKAMWSPTGGVAISGRRDLAYQKLKQRWVATMLAQLSMMEEQMIEKEEADGFGWS